MTEQEIEAVLKALEEMPEKYFGFTIGYLQKRDNCPEDGGFLTADGECNHPNHPDGSHGSASSMYSQEVQALLGMEYKGFKGAAAINKLLQERNGHIKNAFNKKGIGSIDLLWGNDDFGLQHIIKNRNAQGYDGESFLYEIPKVIQQGKVKLQPDGKFAVEFNGIRAIITSNLLGDSDIKFLLTAFETN